MVGVVPASAYLMTRLILPGKAGRRTAGFNGLGGWMVAEALKVCGRIARSGKYRPTLSVGPAEGAEMAGLYDGDGWVQGAWSGHRCMEWPCDQRS